MKKNISKLFSAVLTAGLVFCQIPGAIAMKPVGGYQGGSQAHNTAYENTIKAAFLKAKEGGNTNVEEYWNIFDCDKKVSPQTNDLALAANAIVLMYNYISENGAIGRAPNGVGPRLSGYGMHPEYKNNSISGLIILFNKALDNNDQVACNSILQEIAELTNL